MPAPSSITQLVVIPRNGYINRLQAWASASILADRIGVPLRILWEEESAAAAPAPTLFDTERAPNFVTRADCDAWLGGAHEDLPRHLTVLDDRRLVVLAGHDRGEQAFMDDLPAALAHESRPTTLVIIAGGKFCLPADSATFVTQRAAFYRTLKWAPGISEPVERLRASRPAYLGVHLRYTDRSYQAPRSSTIRRALIGMRNETGLRSLFVAADSAVTRDAWMQIASDLGFEPWHSSLISFDRASSTGGEAAMIDWILLSHTRGLVYFAASSFAEEAAVASGFFSSSLGLPPSRVRHDALVAREFVRAAMTYPERRWTNR